jgi:hypothetical protein
MSDQPHQSDAVTPTKPLDDRMGLRDVAEAAGVAYQTIRVHQCRGTMPKADGRIGGSPYWFRWRIEQWVAQRPRQGQRWVKPFDPIRPNNRLITEPLTPDKDSVPRWWEVGPTAAQG